MNLGVYFTNAELAELLKEFSLAKNVIVLRKICGPSPPPKKKNKETGHFRIS
jgi:hypothetical protein